MSDKKPTKDDFQVGEFEEFFEDGEELPKEEEEEKVEEEAEESISTAFSQMTLDETFPPDIKNSPRYKEVVSFVKEVLESLVAKRPENVVDYFSEYSRRVHEKIPETFGVDDEYFFPAALFYSRSMRSFTLGFDKVFEDEEEALEAGMSASALETVEEEEDKGELYYATHIMEYTIEDDDFDENGRHGKPVIYDPKIDYEYNEFDYNFLDQMKVFDDVGIGLTKHEQFEVHMALLKLNKKRKLTNLKFWGKIKGLYRDYYIAEADMYALAEEVYDQLEEIEEEVPGLVIRDSIFFDEEEGTERPFLLEKRFPSAEIEGEMSIEEVEIVPPEEEDDLNISESNPEEGIIEEEVENEEEAEQVPEEITPFELEVAEEQIPIERLNLINYKLPPLPQLKWTPEKKPPMENPGEGTNRKIYFVCNDPKAEWIRLPHVTPEQIVIARQVSKLFTGYLSARVLSYPVFPGIEMNYLRAQIARISAGTQISPAGYYRFDEGEEAYDPDEILAGKGGVLINKEFDPLPIKDLTDPSLAFWVHHTQHILKQGRTAWFNVNKKKQPMMVEGEAFGEFGEDRMDDGVIGETGPPLLTSLAEDIFVEGIPPWTVRPALECAPADACIYVRSNLWPGAYSFSWGRRIGFLYIGWGLKNRPAGFTPVTPYKPMSEYPQGLDIMEDKDPTVLEEEEYKKRMEEWYLRLHPPIPPGFLGEAGEE